VSYKIPPIPKEDNDILIKEQFQIIEALRQKCNELEEEILNQKQYDGILNKGEIKSYLKFFNNLRIKC
jgi:hypothetical protein